MARCCGSPERCERAQGNSGIWLCEARLACRWGLAPPMHCCTAPRAPGGSRDCATRTICIASSRDGATTTACTEPTGGAAVDRFCLLLAAGAGVGNLSKFKTLDKIQGNTCIACQSDGERRV